MTLWAVLPGLRSSILQTNWAAGPGDGEETATPEIEDQEELEQDLEGVDYLCKFCRRKITTASEKIVVNGQHTHMCANPYGLLFEVGCFARASGCLTTGVPTLEFTWFPGYAWSIAICASCANHMGWHYTAQPPSEFYGLILDHLVQASSSG